MITDDGNYIDHKVKVRPFKMAHCHSVNKGVHYEAINIPSIKYNDKQTLSDGSVRLNATGGNKRRRYASTKGFSNLT